MSVIIEEQLYKKNNDDTREELESAMHSTLWPLESLVEVLKQSSNGEINEVVLVMESLLEQATIMQSGLVTYLESKVGRICFVHSGTIGRSSQIHKFIAGIEIDGNQVTGGKQ